MFPYVQISEFGPRLNVSAWKIYEISSYLNSDSCEDKPLSQKSEP